MTLTQKTKSDLNKKFQKVLQTPASFGFFAAVHDFIGYIESNSALSAGLSRRVKANQELNIGTKYAHLKQIYQGVQDIKVPSKKDLGHERYSTIRDLSRIEKNDVSESNFFWRKRELWRKLVVEVHGRLDAHLSGSKQEV